MRANQLKTGLIALLLIGMTAMGAIVAAGAQVSADSVSIDQPSNQQVETTLSWSGSADATVSLQSPDGSATYASETVTGASGDTKTLTLSAENAPVGNVSLVVESPSASSVSVDSRSMVVTEQVEIDNATLQSLDVVTEFAGPSADATITVEDSAGAVVLNDTLAYMTEEVKTVSYSATDGLESGNLTVSVETTPATSYAGVSASVSAGSGSGGAGGGLIPEAPSVDVPSVSLSSIPGGSAALAAGAILLVMLLAAAIQARR